LGAGGPSTKLRQTPEELRKIPDVTIVPGLARAPD